MIRIVSFLLLLYSRQATPSWLNRNPTRVHLPPSTWMRGGDVQNESVSTIDDERYSRQVYTLGAKAHARVRTSVVILDGPASSGLTYECAKNLALSGVGHISILDRPNAITADDQMDDLGDAYQRAAKIELGRTDDDSVSDNEILAEYIQRLNPDVSVDIISAEEIPQEGENSNDARRILLSIGRTVKEQAVANDLARSKGIAFVGLETMGVYSRVFSDFGDSFQVDDVDGEDPLVVPFDKIAVDNDQSFAHCVQDEKHDVSKGDIIEFQCRDGSTADLRLVVSEVKSPFRFAVKQENGEAISQDQIDSINSEASTFRRVKAPVEFSFSSISSVYDNALTDGSLFTPSDLDKSFDECRRSILFACFQSRSAFLEANSRTPQIGDYDDFVRLMSKTMENNYQTISSSEKNHIRKFLRTNTAQFAPLEAALGAIGAQEVLKAVTGLYNPIQQILMFDCDEVIESDNDYLMSSPELAGTECRGLRYLLGNKVVDELQGQRVFVVGAGAIGCEVLKNLAALGVGTREGGAIVLTDMDTIEKSNLSRQFLFRDKNIGDFKSLAASEAIGSFNMRVVTETHSSKVGSGDDNSPFTHRFWKRLDVVLNALDNIEARLFMDGQCVTYGKALVDSGTLGSKGNVQVVVPGQSESYSSSVDPPQDSIPVCTLKNFPYAIAHTIQWGRDTFNGLFERRPSQANKASELLQSLDSDALSSHYLASLGPDAAIELSVELSEDLNPSIPVEPSELRVYTLKWAVQLADKLFRESVQDLFRQHPPDSVDEDGEPFWSGTRRQPCQLWYEPESDNPAQSVVNDNIVEFVRQAARLRLETISGYNENNLPTIQEVEKALVDTALYRDLDQKGGFTAEQEVRRRLSSVKGGIMHEVEFEKDDESNGHVAFVTAASNLRAISYGIPPASRMETRKVAGNIIPAMISTTALVSALSCVELVKLVQKQPLNSMKNSFCNLALPFFAFTSPLPAESDPGIRGQSYTIWDRIHVKEKRKDDGGITIKRLIRRILRKSSSDQDGLTVSSISLGPYLLYAQFLHEQDRTLLKSPLWEALESAVSEDEDEDFASRDDEDDDAPEFSPNTEFVDLTVVVEDSRNDEEIQLPPVRVQRRRAPEHDE